MVASLLTAGTIAGAGWSAHDYLTDSFASKETMMVVGVKADYLLDLQTENLVRQVAHLENKKNKTPDEIEHLRYLRQQIETLRKTRAGAKRN